MRAHRGRGLCTLVLQSSKHEPCLTWVGALICCALTFGPACEVSVSLFILDSFLWTSYRSFKLLMSQTDINIYHLLLYSLAAFGITPTPPSSNPVLWGHPGLFLLLYFPQSVLEKVLGTSLKSISLHCLCCKTDQHYLFTGPYYGLQAGPNHPLLHTAAARKTC